MTSSKHVPDLRALVPDTLNRRQALKLGGASALSLWITACGGGGTKRSASVATKSPLEKQLLIANWVAYTSPAAYKAFTQTEGPKISLDGYGSNEELLAKLSAGGADYDIVVPSNGAVKVMIAKSQALKLNHALLPNLKNLQPKFRSLPYDPGNRYSVAKNFGVTSFFWRSAVVKSPPTTLKEAFQVLHDLPSDARVNFVDSASDVAVIALLALGYDVNTEVQSQYDDASKLLKSVKPKIQTFSSEYIPRGSAGEIDFGLGWNADVARIIAARAKKGDEVVLLLPETTPTAFWVDNWAIPASAKNPVAAHRWINYMLDPKVAAKEAAYVRAPYPIEGIDRYAPKDIVNNPDIYIDPAKIARYKVDNPTPRVVQLQQQLYTDFKAV